MTIITGRNELQPWRVYEDLFCPEHPNALYDRRALPKYQAIAKSIRRAGINPKEERTKLVRLSARRHQWESAPAMRTPYSEGCVDAGFDRHGGADVASSVRLRPGVSFESRGVGSECLFCQFDGLERTWTNPGNAADRESASPTAVREPDTPQQAPRHSGIPRNDRIPLYWMSKQLQPWSRLTDAGRALNGAFAAGGSVRVQPLPHLAQAIDCPGTLRPVRQQWLERRHDFAAVNSSWISSGTTRHPAIKFAIATCGTVTNRRAIA